ncbi:MAG TPA: Ig-like domain-containing protein, partial [Ramlibacter sp.]|nr:Ig-like domain-containing protein [Ramlibacter sp.]
MADDYAGNSSTTGVFPLGGTVGGMIETFGDSDWFAVSLVSGQTYNFSLNAASLGGLYDPYLSLYNSSGTFLTSNDDGGVGLNSLLTFAATYTGTHYLAATAYNNNYTGTYLLSTDTVAPLVQAFNPADEATAVATGANIVLTFNESIQRGIGTIYLRTDAGAFVEGFDVASSGRLAISGATLTIDPTANLLYSTGYRVEFFEENIRDLAGNGYAGTFSYNFTTQAAPVFNGTNGDDTYTGSAGDDTINGLAGNDVLDGSAGNDSIDGGPGNDLLHGSAGSDALAGGTGNDTLDGGAILDRINYTDFNSASYGDSTAGVAVNLATGMALDGMGGHDALININFIFGSAYGDTMTGSSGPIFEQFDGGLGSDTIDGGTIDGATGLNANRVSYSNAPSAINASLATGLVTGGGGNDTLVNINYLRATNFADILAGSDTTAHTEIFEGRGGNDTIDGKGGVDLVRFDSATGAVNVNLVTGVALDGQGGTDTLSNIEGIRGTPFNDTLTGGNAANGTGSSDGFEFFMGNAGNDAINGGGGYDRADYTTSTIGVVVTLGGTVDGTAADGFGGTDTLASIEGVRGSEFSDNLTGSSSGEFETFEGRGGNDAIQGNGGIDRVDYLSAISGVTVSLATGTAQDGYGTVDTLAGIEQVRGSSFGDSITGDAGDNTLQGGAGNDTLDGGGGTDTAVFTSNFAVNAITAGSGTDFVVTGPEGSDTLRSIEVLQFADRSFAYRQGVAASELITVTGTVDTIVHAREGNDTVAGNLGNDALYGDEGTDSLDGGGGNDTLDGGTGNDTMAGSTGDDTYVVDSLLDVVNETLPLGLLKDPLADNPGGGVDTVLASINYTLGNFLENLTIAGAAGALTGTGNALANVLTGNASNNSLHGAAGNDTLEGGDG